jgi:predicted secreted protein
MPWGDGIVDMNDLRIFIKYWEKENFKNVDDDENGSNVTLKPDQRLIVTLQSNPSTGYSWEVLEDTNSILEQMGEAEFVSSVEGGETVGAGGWEIFRFKAISYGQMTLTLLYRRTGEPEAEPAGTFSIEVKVDWRGGLPPSLVAKVKKNR